LPMPAVLLVRRSLNSLSDPGVADRNLNHSDLAHISTAFTLEL
jgi:hypothetical protein